MNQLKKINNTFESYQQLITLYNSNKHRSFETIEVEIHEWFAANMCSALGGLLDKLSDNLNQITIKNCSLAVERILLKNDFLSYFGHQRISDTNHTTIRFLKLNPTDGKFFNNYVITELIERNELPKMSTLVKEKMAEAIYEIYVNAQIHSNTKNIYTCGQFYPNENKIEFTITDVGIGFKNKVNQRFDKNLTSTQAIKWATQDTHTTKQGITGGIGLAVLKEFVARNKGKMQIISDDGFYQFDTSGEQTQIFDGSFPGTIVNLQFKTDDNTSYKLQSEVTDIF